MNFECPTQFILFQGVDKNKNVEHLHKEKVDPFLLLFGEV